MTNYAIRTIRYRTELLLTYIYPSHTIKSNNFSLEYSRGRLLDSVYVRLGLFLGLFIYEGIIFILLSIIMRLSKIFNIVARFWTYGANESNALSLLKVSEK